jgi:hypothetical protein
MLVARIPGLSYLTSHASLITKHIHKLTIIDNNLTNIPGEIFHIGYSGSNMAAGFPGITPITLAGLTTTAEVGVVNVLVSPVYPT